MLTPPDLDNASLKPSSQVTVRSLSRQFTTTLFQMKHGKSLGGLVHPVLSSDLQIQARACTHTHTHLHQPLLHSAEIDRELELGLRLKVCMVGFCPSEDLGANLTVISALRLL